MEVKQLSSGQSYTFNQVQGKPSPEELYKSLEDNDQVDIILTAEDGSYYTVSSHKDQPIDLAELGNAVPELKDLLQDFDKNHDKKVSEDDLKYGTLETLNYIKKEVSHLIGETVVEVGLIGGAVGLGGGTVLAAFGGPKAYVGGTKGMLKSIGTLGLESSKNGLKLGLQIGLAIGAVVGTGLFATTLGDYKEPTLPVR